MDNFNQLLEDPAFGLGLSLMGGAREKNPVLASMAAFQGWQGAQARQQENRMQADMYKQRVEQMKQEAERKKRAEEWASTELPNAADGASLSDFMLKGAKAGVLPLEQVLPVLQKQEELKSQKQMMLDAQKQIATDKNTTTLEKQRLDAEAKMKHDELMSQYQQGNLELRKMGLGIQAQMAQFSGMNAETNRMNALSQDEARQENAKIRRAQLAQGDEKLKQSVTGGGKMPAELKRMDVGLDAAIKGLDRWDELLKDYNPRTDMANPAKRSKLDSVAADLKLQIKEAQALGALAGPDVGLLEDMVGNAGSASALFYGQKGLKEKSKEAREALMRRKTIINESYPKADATAPSPAAGGGWKIEKIR